MKDKGLKIHLLSECDRVKKLVELFDEFYANFQKNDYDKMNEIAAICKETIDEYFSAECLDEICNRPESLDMIVDILCFVYPAMFMYNEEVEMLTAIAESNSAAVKIRCRAIETIFSPELEAYIKDKKLYYAELKESLKEVDDNKMESRNSKKKYISTAFFSSIPFLAIWWFIALAVSVARSEGALSIYTDAYGKGVAMAMLIFGFVAFTSVIFSRFFVKREIFVQSIAYILTIVFCICAITVANVGTAKFAEFTPDKWKEYPARRLDMYSNLVASYDYKNIWTPSSAVSLLGEPDEIINHDDPGVVSYIYDSTCGNYVDVIFKDGKCMGISDNR